MDFNRQDYIRVRKSLNLDLLPSALAWHLLKDLGLCSALFFIWNASESWMVRVLCVPFLAILIFRSFAIMHDATHGAISKNKILNHAVGIFSGGLAFLPYEQWRQSHLQHHFWSGNLEKDPVMGVLKAYPRFPKWLQNTLHLGWKTWIPTFSMAQHSLFWVLSLKQGFSRQAPFLTSFSLASAFVIWGSLIAFTPEGFVPLIILPTVLTYLLGTELINMPHHLQLVQIVGDKKFQVWEQHETARTCVYPRWFARNVVLNFNYHSAHHMVPDAPWYHLENVHEALHGQIGPDLKMDLNLGWSVINRKRSFADVLYHEPETQQTKAA